MRPSLVAYLQEYLYNTFVLFTILPNMNEWNVWSELSNNSVVFIIQSFFHICIHNAGIEDYW